METKTYNFKVQRAGDTFNGLQITCSRTSNEITTPIDLTGVVIKMDIKKHCKLEPIKTISTVEGITIVDALSGVFKIDAFLVPNVESFNYVYDMQFTFANNVVKTYLEGSFAIKKDITSN